MVGGEGNQGEEGNPGGEKKEGRVVTARKMNVILKCCITWLTFCRRSRVMRRRTRRRRRIAVAEENVAEKQEESE